MILLDIIIPPGNVSKTYNRYSGMEFLEELRTQHKIATPVVVLSVVSKDAVNRRLWELGVKGIVRKPVLPSKLKELVERVLADIEGAVSG